MMVETTIASRMSVMLDAKHMRLGPKGQKRPTGKTEDGKSKAAVELGRKGGQARAVSLSSNERRQIAKKAARARWKD